MSIFRHLRDFLRGPVRPDSSPPPTSLRNKPGGLAYINANVDEGQGSAALVNRYVTTLQVVQGDMWIIDPPQQYVVTSESLFVASGVRAAAGEVVTAMGLRDHCLTPVRGIGDHERSQELDCLPTVPAAKRSREKA